MIDRYQLWLRIKGFVPEIVGKSRRALGCSPRIRVYRCLVVQQGRYARMHPIELSLRRNFSKKLWKLGLVMTCIYLLFFCFSSDFLTLSCYIIYTCSCRTTVFWNIWKKSGIFRVFQIHLLYQVNDHDPDSIHIVWGPQIFSASWILWHQLSVEENSIFLEISFQCESHRFSSWMPGSFQSVHSQWKSQISTDFILELLYRTI